jgi:hypothetical protein
MSRIRYETAISFKPTPPPKRAPKPPKRTRGNNLCSILRAAYMPSLQRPGLGSSRHRKWVFYCQPFIRSLSSRELPPPSTFFLSHSFTFLFIFLESLETNSRFVKYLLITSCAMCTKNLLFCQSNDLYLPIYTCMVNQLTTNPLAHSRETFAKSSHLNTKQCWKLPAFYLNIYEVE